MSTRPGTLVHRANHEPSQQPYGGRPIHEQQRRTTSKPLNFKKAMDDFQFMFPELDRHVIETVLRANNGVVQSTIDQLLILQESTQSEISPKEENFDLSFDLPTYESSIGNGEEPPPAYSAVWEEPSRDIIDGPKKTIAKDESIKRQSLLMANTFWKAPLIGDLPDDFLRLDLSVKAPVKKKSLNTRYQHSTSPPNEFLTEEENNISEDEKLAIYLQNEEFLRELRRNQEFVSSLEADHRRAMMASGGTTTTTQSLGPTNEPFSTSPLEQPSVTPPTESVSSGGARPRTTNPVLDDAAFKQKLKHMGKSTKKKFSKMAKKFSRRNPGTRNQFLHASDSTFNLLENNEDETEYVEEGLNGIIEADGEEYDEDDVTNERINRSEERSATGGRHLPKTPLRTQTQIPQVNGHSGRQLPHPPGGGGGGTKSGNTEPIVFYDDDNEFSYKNE